MNDNLSASSLTTSSPVSLLSGESNPLGRRIEILLQIQNRSNLILLLRGGGVPEGGGGSDTCSRLKSYFQGFVLPTTPPVGHPSSPGRGELRYSGK